MGKSRLCYEFIHHTLRPPWLILEAQGTAHDQVAPYQPVIDLLRNYFRLDDGADLPTIRDQVSAALHGSDEALTTIVPPLLALLGVPMDEPSWQGLEALQRRQHMLDAVKRLLLWESQRQPLLLVVENLHWVDGETQAVLDRLVDSLPTARVLLLMTYRPEFRHDWGSKTYYTQLRLDPLSHDSADALLTSLLGKDVALAPLKSRLHEFTQGNPFFLEECVRTMVETQSLIGAPGDYRPAQPLLSLLVPASVQAVLAARIDQLSAGEKHLLQTDAVSGRDVSWTLLQTVADLPAGDLRRHLDRLQGAELLYETRLFPASEYTFKHALTYEVAYRSLLPERRRALHARIMEALEMQAGDRLSGQVERLAYHARQGEVWEKALVFCQQAGAKSAERSAYRETVAFYEQALEALQHLPKSRHTAEQAIDLRLALRAPLQLLGELRRIRDLLGEAVALAETLDDQCRLGRVSERLCAVSWQMGEYAPALACGQRALAIGMAQGDKRLRLNAHLHLAYTHHALGEHAKALAYLRANVHSIEGGLPPQSLGAAGDNTVTCRSRLCVCCAELGAFAEGITHGAEGMRVAEASDHPFSRASAYGGLGYLYLRQGALPQAVAMLEQGLELCRVWQIQLLFPWLASSFGMVYTLSGRVGEALPLLERAVAEAKKMQFMPYVSEGFTALGEGLLRAGRFEEALSSAHGAVREARQRRERGHEAYALHLLGEIAARRHLAAIEPAEGYYRQAMERAEVLGMRPLAAHCHYGLGTLHARAQQPIQAGTELAIAIDLYRAMEMTFWLSQAEAALVYPGE